MTRGKEENSYSNIIKRISSFGGVQIFNILITLIRGKFVALFLGPEGMGISSLFTSSTTTLQQFAGLGLNLAMVKEVASNKDDAERIPHILSVAIRLITFTSIVGGILCFLLSPLLSYWSYGDFSYTLSFMALSASVCLMIGGAGYLSLLQGMGEVKRLSKASLVGGSTGLLLGVPLYYFFGYNGIVPAMIILALASFLFYFFSYRKSVLIDKIKFTWQSHKPLVKKLITLGLLLMAGNLVGTATNYIINIFIRAFGSIDNVGLFQAANSLTNQYIGVVFSAMALDYFPRLTGAGSDIGKVNFIVNRQAEIVILISTPLILLLILTTPVVIELLLSESFMIITPLMRWLGFGVLLQTVSFPMGYLFISKDNKKPYIWVEIVFTNLLWIICSFVFYYYFGLIGLGISLVVRYIIDIVVVYLVCRSVFEFRYSIRTVTITGICLLLGAGGFLSTWLEYRLSVCVQLTVLTISIIFSGFLLLKALKGEKKTD